MEITVDAMVKATYNLEGDGPCTTVQSKIIIMKKYVHLCTVGNSVKYSKAVAQAEV